MPLQGYRENNAVSSVFSFVHKQQKIWRQNMYRCIKRKNPTILGSFLFEKEPDSNSVGAVKLEKDGKLCAGTLKTANSNYGITEHRLLQPLFVSVQILTMNQWLGLKIMNSAAVPNLAFQIYNIYTRGILVRTGLHAYFTYNKPVRLTVMLVLNCDNRNGMVAAKSQSTMARKIISPPPKSGDEITLNLVPGKLL